MKFALFIFVGALLSIAVGATVWNSASCAYTPRQSGESHRGVAAGERRPVLVELFTSEGCSSCPPADRQLAFMQQNQPVSDAEIITLAYHVDYWDRLGWKDRFSSPEFSERQNSYTLAKHLDSSYTPQMIVDGEAQFVGSDARQADKAVEQAASSGKGIVKINISDGKLNLVVNDLPTHAPAEVLLAIAEDKLETDVKRGENGGLKLAHTAVVRNLKEVGTINSGDGKFEMTLSPPSNADWNDENLRYVVFVQENRSKKVIAVGSIPAR